MVYDLSSLANQTSILGVFTAVNTITDQWFSIVLLLLIWIISYIVFTEMTPTDRKSGMLIQGFVTLIASLLMMASGLISVFWVTYALLYMIFVLIIFIWRSE